MYRMSHAKPHHGAVAAPFRRASLVKTFVLVLTLICLNCGISLLKVTDQAADTATQAHGLPDRRLLAWGDHATTKDQHSVAIFSSVAPTNDSGSTGEDCTALHKVADSKKCHFVKSKPDCHQSDGFLQYLQFPYCTIPHATALAFIIMFLWLLFLFIVLGTTADEYFCPSLAIISRTLRLSQNVAGVTFLAYGNGAPDIFSALAAFSHVQQSGSAQLGIQALFGAGMFVTTIVVGVVSFTARLELTNRPFIRDVLFYLGAVTWTFITLYRETIDMKQAIGFIALYVAYVVVVIGGRFVYQRFIKRGTVVQVTRINAADGEVSPSSLQGFAESLKGGAGSSSSPLSRAEQKPSTATQNQDGTNSHRAQHHTISEALFTTETTLVASALHEVPQPSVLSRENSQERDDEETPLLGEKPKSPRPLRKFLAALVPIDVVEWKQCGVLWKIFLIFKAPAVFFLNLTIPVVDWDEDDHRWNKWLNVLHCIMAPLFGVFLTKVGTILLVERFPVWALTLCIAVILALLVAVTTDHDKPPRFHWLFAYLAFVISVIWIYSTANEIVNLLQTFGLAFGLSDAILGLTFLAWGNSIGDFVSNTAMARQGFPQMAVSACFGGPLLNMLLGIGISCTVGTITQGKPIPLLHQSHQYLVSAGFLVASLSSSAIVIPLLGFHVPRAYGAYLILLYITYLIVSIVVEVKNI